MQTLMSSGGEAMTNKTNDTTIGKPTGSIQTNHLFVLETNLLVLKHLATGLGKHRAIITCIRFWKKHN